MRIILILAILASVSGCAHTDEWTRQDTIRQSVYSATLVVDALQTSDIKYHDDVKESGWIASRVLGSNPTTSGTWQYFITLGISNYLIARALPVEWRPHWQGASTYQHTSVILTNCANGLGSFCKGDQHE